MKTISQFGGVLLALFLCLFLLPVPAGAEDEGEEIGNSGVYWSLDNGTLTISGEGAMPDNLDQWPWDSQKNDIKMVIIQDGVTSIGNYAFQNCITLQTVTFAEGSQLETFGAHAFRDCKGLTSIEIPASVTSIGNNAFQNCTNLQTVTFAEGSKLETIGNNAFQNCSNLTSIEIPASVTSIGDYAFQGCQGIENITIPAGVTTIRNYAFFNCTSLRTVKFNDSNTLKTIGISAFSGCQRLTSIAIPASVTSIGDYAFFNCTKLTSITIPASATSIGEYAFSRCQGLASIEIPASVTSIGNYAFENCTNLGEVTFTGTSKVPIIGAYTFQKCSTLTTINIPTAQGYGGGNWPTGVDYVVSNTGATYRHVIVKKSGGNESCTVEPGTSLVQVGDTSSVTLTATAGSDYYFTGWNVESISSTIEDFNKKTLTFTMRETTDVTVTANFVKAAGIYIGKTPLEVDLYYVFHQNDWSSTVEVSDNYGDSYARLTEDETDGYTLTLHNFTYNGPGYEYQDSASHHYAAIFANKPLTIKLEGENSVTESGYYDNDSFSTTAYGIYVVAEDLKVTGEGSLTATGGMSNCGSNYGVCVASGSLTVSGGKLTGTGGFGTGGWGVSAANIIVKDGGKLTGTGGGQSHKCVGVSSGSLTVNGGELVAKGGTVPESYGVQYDGNITITVTNGRIIATGKTSAVFSGVDEGIITVAAEENAAYAWRTQESGPYTYSDSDKGQYQYNWEDTYLEVASIHTLTVNQAEGGTVSVSPDGSNNCYPAGADITLTATPNSGYQFSGWTVEGVSVSNTTANPLTFTMPTNDVTVTASSSGGGVPSRPDPKPEGPSTGGSKGWEDIQQELENAKDGETVTIDMNGETEVPGEVWETIAGRDVTVILDMGENVSWTVDGTDVPPGATFGNMDFGVDLGTSGISVDVINAITGEVSSVQITLAHDGEFGFILTLTAPLGAENAGYWANLYHYDEDDETLNYETSGEIKEDGTASLRMTHASQYAIIIDKQTHQLPFTDVASGAWYEQAVRYAYLNDIMAGTSGTAFQPNGTLSRAMAVQILYNLEGQPDISGENLDYPYSDVDASQWYGNAVYWARITGVAEGDGDGIFRPTDSITRQEFAQMLYNYAQYKGYDLTAQGDLSTFPDSGKIAGWAKTAMSWANGNKLINGHDDGTLEPGGTATRAQAASILIRFDQNVVEK